MYIHFHICILKSTLDHFLERDYTCLNCRLSLKELCNTKVADFH